MQLDKNGLIRKTNIEDILTHWFDYHIKKGEKAWAEEANNPRCLTLPRARKKFIH